MSDFEKDKFEKDKQEFNEAFQGLKETLKETIDILKKEKVKKKTHFVCEICHELTPIECEGSEPNTCAMCMPLQDNEN